MEEQKNKITGGDILIKCLLKEDVKLMFGIPGGQFLQMYDAVYRWGREKGIDTILFRHEQAAAHAADAWARVTNTPGICFGTAGPGAVDLMPGINAAWGDNIPVIAIVPQVNSKFQDSHTLQSGLDQITMFTPITKYQKSVMKAEEIPDAVQKCFREATGGRPRPVLLEIYEDAFIGEVEEDTVKILDKNQYRALEQPAISEKAIKESLDLLAGATKPLIVSGGGVSRAGAWNELKEFAEYFQIPVMETIMGIGTLTNKSKCLVGATIAGPGLKAAAEADVVLALGCRFTYVMGHGEEPFWKDSQKLIQVDIDPSIIGRQKPVTLGIIGDCKQYLKQMIGASKQLQKVEKRDWLEEIYDIRLKTIETTKKKSSKDKIPIEPKRMIKDIFEWMDEDAIVIADGGDIVCYAFEQIDFYKDRPPLSTLQTAGMGQLGTSVPYGIGVKLAKPEKQVITISGDGSFMINIQDLETAVRLGLKNLIYVIGNNDAWGMIKSGQKLFCQKHYIDVDLPPFDYAKCAEGFGCYGEVVTDPNELKPALDRAKNSGKPAVLDVKIKFDTPDATKLMGSMGIL